jgi:tetratricopeptide (TPR) repeat protein
MGLYQVDCLLNAFHVLPLLTAAGGLICISREGWEGRDSVGMTGKHARAVLDEVAEVGSFEVEPDNVFRVSPQVKLAYRYMNLSRNLRSRGLSGDARTALSHALDLLANERCDDQHPETRTLRWDCTNDLAWLLLHDNASSMTDPGFALQLAREATEANPTCAIYWNTLGAAFYKSGDITQCILAIKRSVSLSDGGTAFDFFILAIAHALQGHLEAAHSWHRKAQVWMMQHNPECPDLIHLNLEALACIAKIVKSE